MIYTLCIYVYAKPEIIEGKIRLVTLHTILDNFHTFRQEFERANGSVQTWTVDRGLDCGLDCGDTYSTNEVRMRIRELE